ncbi:MAG: hypothetical protein LBC27_06955, partial [Spirochaetaceae bacterium]|jgi:hypothetical protein|nr:hypothetical protein [Spirochaetaceae bacterium]
LGFIEQTEQHNPAGIDIGTIEGKVKPAAFMVSAVMNRVYLEKRWFSLIPGVMNPDGDGMFQIFSPFGAGKTPEEALFPFLFDLPVDGGGTDGKEFFFDGGGDMKDLLLFEEGHVRPDEGGKELPAHEAEIFPDGF